MSTILSCLSQRQLWKDVCALILLIQSSMAVTTLADESPLTEQERAKRLAVITIINTLLLSGPDLPRGTIVFKIGSTDSNSYGNGFGGNEHPDGLNGAFYVGNREDLVLSVEGFDIDTGDEIGVYINGKLVGYLAAGSDGALTDTQRFTIPYYWLTTGYNFLEFKVEDSDSIWGVTDIAVRKYTDPTGRNLALGFPVLYDFEWNETSVRRVLNTLAYGGQATDEQISGWSTMDPQQAVAEMLTFDPVNDQLSPVSIMDNYPGPAANQTTFWKFSGYLSDSASNLPIGPTDRDRFSLDEWDFEGTWTRMVTTRGLNPFRQKIGFWETNYHMATNLNTEVNRHQMARYYDDILQAHENDRPYEEVIGVAALSAAVATQYEHRHNHWDPVNNEFHGNEDFAREIHQLFFGILGEQDLLGIDHHEEITIKETAKALTDMQVDYSQTLGRLPEVVTFGTSEHYPSNLYLDILNQQIPGSTAKERIENLVPYSIEHVESLDNLPVKIIAGLLDDNLSQNKIDSIRHAWANMYPKNLLDFLRAYAVSTLFHSTDRVKYWTSFDRHVMVANKMSLNNTEALLDLYKSDLFNGDTVEAFRPSHNVFGGQTGLEAAESQAAFQNNYNNVTLNYWRLARTNCDDCDNGGPWVKDWASVIPTNTQGEHTVADVARWLWQHFIGDGWRNYGPLERAHLHGLLGSKRDINLLLAIRDARLNDSNPNNNNVTLLDLENDYNSITDQQLIEYPYTRNDVVNTSYVVDLVNELGQRSLLLDSIDVDERQTANARIGQAVNFIIGTPFIFAQEGR